MKNGSSPMSLGRSLALSLGVAGTTSLACAAGLASWIYLVTCVWVDVGEVTGFANFQLQMAAGRFDDWAKEHDGRFPPQGAASQELLVPGPSHALDPWERPFQYEVTSPEGTEARVFSLGKDGAPGGERLDADMVWWIGPDGIGHSNDVRLRPESWYQRMHSASPTSR